MARMPTLHVVILAEHQGRWIAADGLLADRVEVLLNRHGLTDDVDHVPDGLDATPQHPEENR